MVKFLFESLQMDSRYSVWPRMYRLGIWINVNVYLCVWINSKSSIKNLIVLLEVHSSRRADWRLIQYIRSKKWKRVDRFGNKVFILCYDSVWLMFDRWRYILPTLPLSISEKEKLGEPKEDIGNLKTDLNICILMISKYNICTLNICILVIPRYNISNLNTIYLI
jgi:hypothetical protein